MFEKEKKQIKLGVLGASGHFGRRIALPVVRSKRFALYGLASRDARKAQDLAHKWGIEKTFDSYEALLNDKEVSAVYIPLPNNLHAEWIKKCADVGKHVLCEKPFALNLAETQDALDYARRAGIKVMEAFMYPYHPQWKRVLEMLACQEIGEIRAVHTFFAYDNKDPNNIRNKPEVGGGALYDIGCYAVSSARLIFGREPQRVLSLLTADPKLGTDVISSAVLDFGKGGRAHLTVSTQSFPHQRLDIFGTGGEISVQIPFNMPTDVPGKILVRTGVCERTVETEAADQYGLMLEAFADHVEKDAPTLLQPKDSLSTMKIIDALFESAKIDSWVTL